MSDTLAAREAAILADPREDGGRLLEEVGAFVRRYVVMSDEQLAAVVLWTAHAHAVDAAESTPYLAVTSAEKRSGKSRVLELLALLAPKPLAAADVSAAAMFRTIADDRPTLLLDEVDALFNRKGADKVEELRGLLNAGHRRGAEVVRMVGNGAAMKAERFPVFCAKALAGIGDLPDTVADRSILIRMKRRRPTETVERFRRREVEPPAAALRARLAAWTEPRLDALAEARPQLPDALDDRAADGWEPLLAIADAAGGEWPARALRAALALSGGRDNGDGSYGVRLLADVRRVFDEREVDRVSSVDLCADLNVLEDSPWGGWRDGKGLDPRTLARRLREYEVVRGTHRLPGGAQVKGYRREDFEESWQRYCDGAADGRGSPPAVQNGTSIGTTVTTGMATGISADPDRYQDRRGTDRKTARTRMETGMGPWYRWNPPSRGRGGF